MEYSGYYIGYVAYIMKNLFYENEKLSKAFNF